VAVLSEAEARARSRLLTVDSYELFFDLRADPVRCQGEVRFRCREPGASTFAELAVPVVRSAFLNDTAVGKPQDGRLALPALVERNVLRVEGEAEFSLTGRGLVSFADPCDGASYVMVTSYPSSAPAMFCCFDQPDLNASVTVSVAVPAGWECVGNGPVVSRPRDGRAGVWRFAAVPGVRPFDVTFFAGPLVTDWSAQGPVPVTVRRRRSLEGADGVAGLAWFGGIAQKAISGYQQVLNVPCPYPGYDIVFVPGLAPLALSVPGLMLVSERLLPRIGDGGDDFAAMVCAHEVAHL
jgi:aminopeptidase N